MDGMAIVPIGKPKGLLYKCKTSHYRSFDLNVVYHEDITDFMTKTPIKDWVKENPDHWELEETQP